MDELDNDTLVKIYNIFTFIKANEATQLISSFTLSDYIDQAVRVIEGPRDNERASKKDKLKRIEDDLNSVIDKISS